MASPVAHRRSPMSVLTGIDIEHLWWFEQHYCQTAMMFYCFGDYCIITLLLTIVILLSLKVIVFDGWIVFVGVYSNSKQSFHSDCKVTYHSWLCNNYQKLIVCQSTCARLREVIMLPVKHTFIYLLLVHDCGGLIFVAAEAAAGSWWYFVIVIASLQANVTYFNQLYLLTVAVIIFCHHFTATVASQW